jgi:uncharacterized membrane protein YcaP (DUF421 family)
MAKCTTVQWLRKPKIADMSIFDWIVSLSVAAIVGYLLKIKKPIHWLLFILAWTLGGVLIHWLAGVPTMLGYYLRINAKPIRTQCD